MHIVLKIIYRCICLDSDYGADHILNQWRLNLAFHCVPQRHLDKHCFAKKYDHAWM